MGLGLKGLMIRALGIHRGLLLSRVCGVRSRVKVSGFRLQG